MHWLLRSWPSCSHHVLGICQTLLTCALQQSQRRTCSHAYNGHIMHWLHHVHRLICHSLCHFPVFCCPDAAPRSCAGSGAHCCWRAVAAAKWRSPLRPGTTHARLHHWQILRHRDALCPHNLALLPGAVDVWSWLTGVDLLAGSRYHVSLCIHLGVSRCRSACI